MIRKLLAKVKKLSIGPLEMAKREGMVVEEGVTVMGGVNFGSEPYLIHLRKYARISVNVTFVTHDGGTWAFRHEERYKKVIKYGRINVGEHSFIGANVTIMPGVTIGNCCVVGAGSVVTKDIPDGMVAVGIPAHVICSTHDYAERCLAQMPEAFDEENYLKNKKNYLIDMYMK